MSPLTFLGRVLPMAVALGLAAGCAADESVRSSELVLEDDVNIVMAMMRQGDFIYTAGSTRLDRIDARTGEVTGVAGFGWSQCPDETGHWLPTVVDRSYPNIAIVGTTFFLHDDSCGFWSFDTVTKKRHMIATAVDAIGGRWNGKPGPRAATAWGIALASDGDGLVACVAASSFGEASDPYDLRGRVELWSFAADGTPREKLATHLVPADGSPFSAYCKEMVVDATSILFSTNRSILRYDRATKEVSSLVAGFERGPRGLAQDAESVFYITDLAEVMSVPRGGGAPSTLVPRVTSLSEPPRLLLQLDGEDLYFYEGYSLRRIPKRGGEVIDFAPGSRENWTFPTALGIGNDHVYFEKVVPTPGRRAVDPSTNEVQVVDRKASLRRARK